MTPEMARAARRKKEEQLKRGLIPNSVVQTIKDKVNEVRNDIANSIRASKSTAPQNGP